MGRKEKNYAVEQSTATNTGLNEEQVLKNFEEILKLQRKQKNNLLGSFVNDKYEISDEIRNALILIPKKYDRVEDNVLYAAVVFDATVLNFKIEMNIEESYCDAKLSLIEIEQGIEEDVKHITVLDSVVEPYMFEFRNHLCEIWNVYYNDVPLEKEDKVNKYLNRQKDEFAFNRELIEILSQLYFLRMSALLDTLGETGEKIKQEYKLMIEKYLHDDPSLTQNFTFQMELLNSVIKKHKGFEVILKTEEGKKILNGFSTPLMNIRDRKYPTVLQEVGKQTKAEDNKKSGKDNAKSKASVKKKGSSPVKFSKPANYLPKPTEIVYKQDPIELEPTQPQAVKQPTRESSQELDNVIKQLGENNDDDVLRNAMEGAEENDAVELLNKENPESEIAVESLKESNQEKIPQDIFIDGRNL